MAKLKTEDEVIVIAGKDKGRRGKITKILPETGKVLVSGVNIAKKHVKPNPQKNIQGGIVEMEMPLDASNVALFNPATEKGDRVGYKLEDGKKVRVFKSSGEQVSQ